MPTKKDSMIEEAKIPSEVELVTLENYVLRKDINPGLIASFKAETLNDKDTARSIEQWDKDFATQSNRIYK